jgi:O-antigen/teichoic acid export membrane protein
VALGRTVMWLARICAARIIGKVPLGEFGLIESTVALFVNFAGLGTTVVISKNVAECYNRDPIRAGRILGTVCLVSGTLFTALFFVFWVSTPFLAAKLGGSPQFFTSLRLGMFLAFQVPCGIAMAVLNAFQRFPQVAVANIIQGAVTLILTLVLAPRWGLDGFLMAYGGAILLMFFYQLVVIRMTLQAYNIRLQFDGVRKEFPLFWRYGLPSLLSGILVGPVDWVTRTYLSRQPGGLGELGLYMAAFSLCSILIAVLSLLHTVSLPVLSSAATLEEKQRGIGQIVFLFWSVSLLITVLVIGLSDTLIKVFLGPEFFKSGPVLAILGLSVGIRMFFTSIGISLIAMDRTWIMALSNTLGEPAFLISGLILVPLFGSLGLAYAHLISSLVTLSLLYINFSKQLLYDISYKGALFFTTIILISALTIRTINNIWINISSLIVLFICSIACIIYYFQCLNISQNMLTDMFASSNDIPYKVKQ